MRLITDTKNILDFLTDVKKVETNGTTLLNCGFRFWRCEDW